VTEAKFDRIKVLSAVTKAQNQLVTVLVHAGVTKPVAHALAKKILNPIRGSVS